MLPIVLSLVLLSLNAVAEDTPTNPIPASAKQSNYKDLAKDNKLTLIDFWASWCGPCAASFPWMESIYTKYNSKGLNVIAINMDEDEKEMRRFLKKHNTSFEILFDGNDSRYSKRFTISTLPMSFLLDSNGKLIGRFVGFTRAKGEDLDKKIGLYLK